MSLLNPVTLEGRVSLTRSEREDPELRPMTALIENVETAALGMAHEEVGGNESEDAFWAHYRQTLARLLCFPDRYGAGKYKGPHKKLFTRIRAQHRRLRREIAERGIERVQMQFPRMGQSLLSITAPKAWRAELDRLIVWACRHLYGSDMAARPFLLPKKLQPKQPVLPVRSEPAKKINALLRDLFRARRIVAAPSHSSSSSSAARVAVEDKDVVALVRVHASFIEGLGLPSEFDSDMHYHTFVPKVVPNRQVILWRRWHATAGARDDSAKMTSFVDVMPVDQLSDQSRLWYEYWARHAPCDPGGGSSRGAWPSYVVKYRRWLMAGRPSDFQWGVPETLRWVRRGSPCLTAEQLETFGREGYLVLDVPDEVARRTEHAAPEFEQWFRVFSGVSDFTFATHTTDLFAPIKPPPKGNDYRYMTDKIDPNDPLNPNATSGKSHNPQAGGKMIAKDSGMGPGSTFCDAPSHLAFQFSDWITNIFSSFYGPVPLVRVLERFRIKQQAAWSAAHVDVDPERMHEHPHVAAAADVVAEEPPQKRARHDNS